MPSLNKVSLSAEDVAGIPESAWRKIEETDDFIRWETTVTMPNGMRGTILRTEAKFVDELVELNAELRKENAQRRYTAGMGSDKGGNMPMVHTASIPLNIYFRDFQDRKGDADYSSWWKRQERNQPFLVRDKGFK